MYSFEVKEERVFVQTVLEAYVDINKVKTCEIQRFKRDISVEGEPVVEQEDSIIESYSLINGVLKRYYHVDNSYWNSILNRSGHRGNDWTEVI